MCSIIIHMPNRTSCCIGLAVPVFLQLGMAEECLSHAVDLSGLLLLYSALGDAEGITRLASLAKEHGKNNVAFLCLFLLGKLEDCLQLLVDRYKTFIQLKHFCYSYKSCILSLQMSLITSFVYSNRIPEAALMARSYLPSKVSDIVALWKKDLNKVQSCCLLSSFAIFWMP